MVISLKFYSNNNVNHSAIKITDKFAINTEHIYNLINVNQIDNLNEEIIVLWLPDYVLESDMNILIDIYELIPDNYPANKIEANKYNLTEELNNFLSKLDDKILIKLINITSLGKLGNQIINNVLSKFIANKFINNKPVETIRKTFYINNDL
jgi:hypothetical protein